MCERVIEFFIFRYVHKIAKRETISFVMPVRLSIWNHLVPTGWIFMKFGIFKKYVCSGFIIIGQE